MPRSRLGIPIQIVSKATQSIFCFAAYVQITKTVGLVIRNELSQLPDVVLGVAGPALIRCRQTVVGTMLLALV